MWLLNTPIAHRGLHNDPVCPENSLAAFTRAVESGYPIELDVRESADGAVIVFHDADLERLTGHAGLVRDMQSSEITALRILRTEERVPLLEDVLRVVDGQAPLLIEIKNDTSRVGPLEERVRNILADYDGELAVQSFNPAVIKYFQQEAPEIVRGQLSCNVDRTNSAGRPELADLLDDNEFVVDFVAYAVNDLPTEATIRVRERGLPVLAWTVTTPEQRQQAVQHADNYIFEGFLP